MDHTLLLGWALLCFFGDVANGRNGNNRRDQESSDDNADQQHEQTCQEEFPIGHPVIVVFLDHGIDDLFGIDRLGVYQTDTASKEGKSTAPSAEETKRR
jgi:hypothetical protein